MVLMEVLAYQIKSLVLVLANQTQNCIVTVIIVICYLFVNVKKIFKLKTNNKNVNFPAKFCLENLGNGFGKSDILNIHKYLMVKNNIE